VGPGEGRSPSGSKIATSNSFNHPTRSSKDKVDSLIDGGARQGAVEGARANTTARSRNTARPSWCLPIDRGCALPASRPGAAVNRFSRGRRCLRARWPTGCRSISTPRAPCHNHRGRRPQTAAPPPTKSLISSSSPAHHQRQHWCWRWAAAGATPTCRRHADRRLDPTTSAADPTRRASRRSGRVEVWGR